MAHPIKLEIKAQFPAAGKLMPKSMTVEKLAHSFMLAIAQKPEIANCDPVSFGVAFRSAAKYGIEPLNHQGYLVPFGSQIVFMPGYRGLIQAARNSGEVSRIEAHVVWAGDKFHHRRGTNPGIDHEPVEDAKPEEGNVRGAYAIAFLNDGGVQFEYMSKAQIDHVRSKSKMGAYGAWASDYPEMARKTVVHRLGKYLPLAAEAREVFEAASQAEVGETIKDVAGSFMDDDPATRPAAKSDRLAQKLAQPTPDEAAERDRQLAELSRTPDVDPETGEIIPEGVGQ